MNNNHLVIYRKYRPKTFGEIVGQEHIVKTLTNALKMGKVAHAYLFCGPRGTGKTTMARLLAKTINCEKTPEPIADSREQIAAVAITDSRKQTAGASPEPCNNCLACKEINEGRSMDLVEIDAASTRGIDDIRELRENIKFSPSRLKYKVFIIDEVHQLTEPAFNALLKTLEEPPAHAIFILATTEVHKLPETIISRCQRFDFHKLPLEKIVERLAWISKQEGIKIEKQALELIALNADGAVRDAESLLGQVISMEDKEITLEEVQAILGISDIKATVDLINFLISREAGQAIAHINQIASDGYDLVQLSKSLISYLRKMMILKADPNLSRLVAPELTKEQLKAILEQGAKLSGADIIRLLNLFILANNEIKSADFQQLPLELAVVEFCQKS